jgi:Tfp pilus assembly protein PilN
LIQEIKINLLPVEYKLKKKSLTWILSRRFVWPVMLAMVTIVSLMTYWVVLNEDKKLLQEVIISQNLSIEKLKPVEKKVKDLKLTIKKINRKNKALLGIQFSKTRWINIFQDLSSVIPSNSWITKITQVEQNSALTLVVSSYQFADIAQYMVDLEKRKSFQTIQLLKINTVKKKNLQAFTYEIKVLLDTDYLLKVGEVL